MSRKKIVPVISLVAALLVVGAVLHVSLGGAQEVESTLVYTPEVVYAEEIKVPEGIGKLNTKELDVHGKPIGVSCATCHAPGKPMARRAEEVDAFHSGLTFAHGNLICASCHHPDQRDTLRLASGEALAFESVIELCGQCHGTQMRDYRHGAHGGMQGFWDQSKGKRVRNNCVHCHDAHAPAYPTVMPARPPADPNGAH